MKAGGKVSSDEVISMLSRYENLMNLVEVVSPLMRNSTSACMLILPCLEYIEKSTPVLLQKSVASCRLRQPQCRRLLMSTSRGLLKS